MKKVLIIIGIIVAIIVVALTIFIVKDFNQE